LENLIRANINEELETAISRAMKIYDSSLESAQLCIPNYVSFNSKSGNRLHPTEKPVDLLRYFIELFSQPSDVVLDPFSGSCSTAEACFLSGRAAHLVERDSEFFTKGLRRVEGLLQNHSTPLLNE
jgi:DNA modification methylase